MMGEVEAAVQAHGLTRDTYIVFSSDNGLHTGEYRLMPGKLTAFDTDIHVPLVVAGPGIPADASVPQVAENIDLASTFASIAGTEVSSDGHSLLALLHGKDVPDWRNAALIEHHGPAVGPGNPDAQNLPSGNPSSYEAMRTPQFLYVEYDNGEREYYALESDPYELHNLARTLPADRLSQLHSELTALESCHDADACWSSRARLALVRSSATGLRRGVVDVLAMQRERDVPIVDFGVEHVAVKQARDVRGEKHLEVHRRRDVLVLGAGLGDDLHPDRRLTG